ncbi:MAG: hypothetical protein JJT96_14190 [Opitutales bacterium]|nr:hypothetical protein [Opitutales bacterium]
MFPEIPSSPRAVIHGEPSHTLACGPVQLAITERGGHLAPVYFDLPDGRRVSPLALAPWEPSEVDPANPPILKVLRGDFFCLPFGGDDAFPTIHGEPANEVWSLEERDGDRLVAALEMREPKGRIEKTIQLHPGHRAVYQEHRISGVSGRYSYGHHAILEFPEEGGPYFFNTSPIRFGGVKPPPYDNPPGGEYGALPPGRTFRDLTKVPLATGGTTDLTQYPAREGFEDLVMVSSRQGTFAWSAATLDGYVWFALKDPRDFPSTLFWLTNGGRHRDPWNGRHKRRLGLEEILNHFSDGLTTARREPLAKRGVPCTREFVATEPVCLRMVQGVHPVPAGFGKVTRLEPIPGQDAIKFANAAGSEVTVPVNWRYLSA